MEAPAEPAPAPDGVDIELLLPAEPAPAPKADDEIELLSLPDECLLRVLSHADLPALLAAAAISRKLRDLARTEELWRARLAARWASNPDPCARAYGLRPWVLCEVTVASLDGKGQAAPRYMPWRCAETPQCRIQVELSYQESVQVTCGYYANVAARLKGSYDQLPDWAFPAYFDVCDADLIDHEWEISFNPHLQGPELKGACVFHQDGCYEDSIVYLRRSKFCQWGLKRLHHDGDGPGKPGLPWPGALGALGMEIDDGGGKHTITRGGDSEWEIRNPAVIARSTGVRAERVIGCRATGLVSRPDLNGMECAVEGFNSAKGRYVVRFVDPKPSAAPRLAGRENPTSQLIIRGGEKVALKPQNVLLPPMAAVEILGLDGDAKALNGRCGRIAPTERVGELTLPSRQVPLPVGVPFWGHDQEPPSELAVRLVELPSGLVCTEDAPAKVVRVPLGKCMLRMK